MTTADTKPSAAGQQLVEHRLDALDRALLGILPRSERLALVAQVETRVRELADGNTAIESSAETAAEPSVIADAVSRRTASAAPKRRSRLALSSGILGIAALAMLFAIPITYVFVATIGEDLGELVSISLLSIHVLAVAIGGLVALVMGIAGLVSLARRKGHLVGHGWAITGLCTAPLPTLVGGLLVLVTSLSLVAVSAVSVETSNPPQVVSTSSYCTSAPEPVGANVITTYSPGPIAPSNMPLPLSAAPTFCAPAAARPQSLPSEATSRPEQINWQMDIDQALKQAKDEKKLVLVHFYGDGCPPCRVVEQQVFPQQQVVQAVLRNYVPVKVNVDQEEKIAARYAVREIPTDVVLGGESGTETYRAISKQSAGEFATLLNSLAIQTGKSSSSTADPETPAASPLTLPSVPTASPPATSPRPGIAAPAPSFASPNRTAPAAPLTSDTLPPLPPRP